MWSGLSTCLRELLNFVFVGRRIDFRSGESDATYGATYVHETHVKELVVGGIFVRVYNRMPDFQLHKPNDFALDLLHFLESHNQTVNTRLAFFPKLNE